MEEMDFSRRDFVKFLGGSGLIAFNLGALSCSIGGTKVSFVGIAPSSVDELILAKGLEYKVLIKWKDAISKDDTFGFNNDYLAWTPVPNKNEKEELILWVNHEYPDPKFVSGHEKGAVKTKKQIDLERYSVGGSLLHIKKNKKSNTWELVPNSSYNKRITAETKIPIISERMIAGSKIAEGSFGNCAGGVTPWNTILTCEENYHDFYGERKFGDKKIKSSKLKWEKEYPNDPFHYGWVVEVNPLNGEAKKLTGLGRFAHECATTIRGKDGRVVVYLADDKAGEHIYKFISKEKNSLEKGELFVADLKAGKWRSLNRGENKELQKKFKDQTELLIHTRVAAKVVGATPCDRPEDIEIHPRSGDVFISLTNNYNRKDLSNSKNNFYGSILKISEKSGDHLSMDFESSTFVTGGEGSGFACPDNLEFDKSGNLWFTSDMSGSMMGKGPYKKMKNNGLFVVPVKGQNAGKVVQIASGPVDSELTGLKFSPDHKELFLSVQHPGEKSKSVKKLSSHWPDGGDSTPRSAVVQISGPLLAKLIT